MLTHAIHQMYFNHEIGIAQSVNHPLYKYLSGIRSRDRSQKIRNTGFSQTVAMHLAKALEILGKFS